MPALSGTHQTAVQPHPTKASWRRAALFAQSFKDVETAISTLEPRLHSYTTLFPQRRESVDEWQDFDSAELLNHQRLVIGARTRGCIVWVLLTAAIVASNANQIERIVLSIVCLLPFAQRLVGNVATWKRTAILDVLCMLAVGLRPVVAQDYELALYFHVVVLWCWTLLIPTQTTVLDSIGWLVCTLTNVLVVLNHSDWEQHLALLLVGTSAVLLSHTASERDRHVAQRRLVGQKQRLSSQRMLVQKLVPPHVAAPLIFRFTQSQSRSNSIGIAERHPDVSIIFIDLCGFTQWSQAIEPETLVHSLNLVVSCLDVLVKNYRLVKIKNIGDCVMVGGNFEGNEADHATQIVQFGLDALLAIQKLKNPADPKHVLTARAGVHVGQVMAGVIGHRSIAYDVFGSTVNMAARLETSGTPGHVHVSSALWRRLPVGRFHAQEQTVDLKGFGQTSTFLIEDRRTANNSVELIREIDDFHQAKILPDNTNENHR